MSKKSQLYLLGMITSIAVMLLALFPIASYIFGEFNSPIIQAIPHYPWLIVLAIICLAAVVVFSVLLHKNERKK